MLKSNERSSSAGWTRGNHKRAMFNNSRSSTESERKTHCAWLIPIIECLTSMSKITTALITDGIIKAVTAHHQVVGLKRSRIQRCFWMSWASKTRPNDGTALIENEKSVETSVCVWEREKNYTTIHGKTCGPLTRAGTAVFMCVRNNRTFLTPRPPALFTTIFPRLPVFHDLLHEDFYKYFFLT